MLQSLVGRRTQTRGLAGRLRGALVLLGLVLAMLALPSSASSYTFGPTVSGNGPEETMYDWSVQRCENNNIPDAPAHAIRDSWGRVQVLVTHWVNYRLIGRSFNDLQLECRRLMQSGESGDPATFNNKEWVTSLYTKDGRTIYALLSNEYQGHLFVGQCNSGNYFSCLYLSMTAAISHDNGDNYVSMPEPLVRATPYQYFKDSGPYGVNVPSNIVKHHDGYYYAFYKSEDYLSQLKGACLMRTRNLNSTRSWRSWDGQHFSIPRKNPYNVVPLQRAEPFRCHPVDFASLENLTHSLTWNTHFDKYLLVGPAGKYDPSRGENVYGIYYSLSDDLINWSDRAADGRGPARVHLAVRR